MKLDYAVFIQDGDGILTFKEMSNIKAKDYFNGCKKLVKGKPFNKDNLLSMAEDIRDKICPCCLAENDYFEQIVGYAQKQNMIMEEDGDYYICVGCMAREC